MAKFDEKKELFAQGKAVGHSNKYLAQSLEICEKTCSAWNNDPAVQARITELLTDSWLSSQAILLSFQKEAVKTIVCLLDSKNEAIRLKAASVLLTLCSSFPDYL